MSDSDDSKGGPGWPDVEQRRGTPRRRADRRAPRPSAVRQPQEGRYNPAERRQAQRRSTGDRRDESSWEELELDVDTEAGPIDEAGLIATAADARLRAHARYSGFQVGAALETVEHVLVTGCNIENASYGLTLCAERVALVKAISDGHLVFTRIAIVTDTPTLTPPCGSCRQLLWEYCGDIEIVLANLAGAVERHRLATLLPLPFDGSRLTGPDV